MLTNIIIEGISAFLSVVAFFFAYNLNEGNFIHNSKSRKFLCITSYVLMAMFIVTFITAIILEKEHFFPATLKIVLLICCFILYRCFIGIGESSFKIHGGYTLIAVFVTILSFTLFFHANEKREIEWNQKIAYNQNVIEQSPQVKEIKHTLVSATDSTKIEGNIHGSLSGRGFGTFFIQRSVMNGNIDGELKQTDIYKFYYIANESTGEIRLMTLNADNTPLFIVKNGETPYLLEKINTPYSIDYNVEPPSVCNVGQSFTTYELHIPENSIVDVFEFDTN